MVLLHQVINSWLENKYPYPLFFFIHKNTEAQRQKLLVQGHVAVRKGTTPKPGSSDHKPNVFSTLAPMPEK